MVKSMSNSRNKLNGFLKLAEDIKRLTVLVECEFLKTVKQISVREKVQIALGRKMFFSFDALIDDAQKNRTEAMHHLRTMVESFVYIFWAGQSEDRGRLIYAKMCNEKLKFFNANPGYATPDECIEWKRSFNKYTNGIEKEWKSFEKENIKKIATECGFESTYNRIYKLACEPVHVTDLLDYMADFDTKAKLSGFWSFIALDYGIFAMCTMLEVCCDYYEFSELRIQLQDIKEKYNKVREDCL